MTKTRRLVAVSAVVSLTTLILAEQNRTGQLPSMRQFISYGLVYFILSIFADFGFEGAGAFGILAMVAIILEQGEDAFNFVAKRSQA
jgi:hypothetical protein